MIESVKKNLISIRKELGFSQENVSDHLKIEQSTYSKIERGLINISIDQLEMVAQLFQLRIIDFFTYPKRYVDPDQIKKESKEVVKAILQIELNNDKKEQVLKLVFGENNLEILNK